MKPVAAPLPRVQGIHEAVGAAANSWCRFMPPDEVSSHLEQAVGLAHGRLEVQALDVLPVLLEQGDQEVDGHLHCTISQAFLLS